MKIVKQTIILAALCMLSVGVQARQFEQGEKLYINSDQTIRDGNGKFNWSDAGANLYRHHPYKTYLYSFDRSH